MADKLAILGGEPVREKPLPTINDASGRTLGDEELALLTEVIRSGSLFKFSGSKVQQFEEEFAKYFGVKHAVGVTSGTASIHCAVGATKLNPGSEVIVTPLTDMGSIIPIIAQNCVPIFVDVDLETLNMDPKDIERKITDKTGAIIAVHYHGNPCDLDPILRMAKKHDLYVIEDCAQALLAEYKGRVVGTMGHMGCFSLQQSKHITTGDGGMSITDDDELGYTMKQFHDKGWVRTAPGPRRYPIFGFNYRMTELQGAVGLAQLKKLPWVVERRVETASRLTELISGIEGLYPPKVEEGNKHVYWQYLIRIESEVLGVSNEDFGKALRAEGIPAGVYLGKPMYTNKPFVEKTFYGTSHCPFECPIHYGRPIEYGEGLCPNAEKAMTQAINIPWNERFTDQDVEDIAKAIRKVADYYLSA